MNRGSATGRFWIGYLTALIVVGLLLLFTKSAKADEHDSTPGMEHAHSHHPDGGAANIEVRRSEVRYSIPNVNVTTMEGMETSLAATLDAKSPILLNFIFTTCTAVCPMLTATFEQFQQELGNDRHSINMISISIDPEHDTPAKLREYAKKFHADTQWNFYTGAVNDVVAVQKAFDVYRGNKMSHIPVMLLRKSPDAPWVRLDGFASAKDLVSEYRQLQVQ